MNFILGFDTSCYTTSMALVDMEGKSIFNRQLLLGVKKGGLGLRQSEAVFSHLRQLPVITKEIAEMVEVNKIVGICVSSKPRPMSDSYMPVFMVSNLIGQVLSNMMNIPLYSVSHQEGHIMAGQYCANGPNKNNFYAIHLSGGTSEMLEVNTNNEGYDIKIIGSSQDLNAGQFVDRIGVIMGLPFPAGQYLEQMATLGQSGKAIIPSYVRNLTIGFSGAETHAKRLLEHGYAKEDVALGVYNCLIKTLEKWIYNATRSRREKDILLVGGVSSSTIIQNRLKERLHKIDENINLYFADKDFSRDNAIGVALLGLKKHQNRHKEEFICKDR